MSSQSSQAKISATNLLFDVQISELDTLLANYAPDECIMYLNGNVATPKEVLQAVQDGTSAAITWRGKWKNKGGFRLEATCLSGGSSGFDEKYRRLWFAAPRRMISAVYGTRPLALANSASDVRFSILPGRPRSTVIIGDETVIPSH